MVKNHYIGSHVATDKDSHPKSSGLAEASPSPCGRTLRTSSSLASHIQRIHKPPLKEREAQDVAEKAAQRAKRRVSDFPNAPTTRSPGKKIVKSVREYVPPQPRRSSDQGYER